MFFSDAMLNKQGPLARIWLAAHWDKKLTKAVVFDTHIETACDSVVNPTVKLALRTSGHLLLGVVRIYNKKTKYLLDDCNDAYVKIKLAFKPTSNQAHDILQIEKPLIQSSSRRNNQNNANFLPSEDFDGADIPEVTQHELNRAMLRNTARIEEITIQHKSSSLEHSNIFKDIMRENEFGFGHNSEWNDTLDSTVDYENMTIEEQRRHSERLSLAKSKQELANLEEEIDIMKELDDVDDIGAEDLFLDEEERAAIKKNEKSEVEEMGMNKTGNGEFSEISKIQNETDLMETDAPLVDNDGFNVPMSPMQNLNANPSVPASPVTNMGPPMSPVIPGSPAHSMHSVASLNPPREQNQIILSPLDPQQVKELQNQHRRAPTRKKRSLLVDSCMEITNSQMKAQLKDYSDIVLSIDTNYDWLAPPTITLMGYKDKGTVEPLFRDPFLGGTCDSKKKWLNSLCYAAGNLNLVETNKKKRNLSKIQREKDATIEEARKDPTLLENITVQSAELSAVEANLSGKPMDQTLTEEPENKKTKLAEEPPKDPSMLDNSLQKTNENMNFSLGPEGDQNSSINMNPMSVQSFCGPMSVQPLSPLEPIREVKDPKEMFQHIDLKKIDDDKKRDTVMLDMIEANMEATQGLTDEPEASFVTLSSNQDRKRASRQFYSLLVLRKQRIIKVEQEKPCSDIKIRKGINFSDGRKLVKI